MVHASAAEPAPVVNPMELINTTGGSVSLAVDIIRVCLDFIPTGLAELQDAIASGQPQRVRAAAHKMAGCVVTFSTGPAYVAARQIETLGAQGELIGIDSVYRELAQGVDQLRVALSDLREQLRSKKPTP